LYFRAVKRWTRVVFYYFRAPLEREGRKGEIRSLCGTIIAILDLRRSTVYIRKRDIFYPNLPSALTVPFLVLFFLGLALLAAGFFVAVFDVFLWGFPYLYYTIYYYYYYYLVVGWVAGLSRDWIIVHIIIFNILLYNIHYLKRKRKLNAPVISNSIFIIGDTHINSIIIFYI
jgi:hypothetical protein